ncbi:MAG: integrase core domain-containing protein [Pseudomonadota bacterium]
MTGYHYRMPMGEALQPFAKVGATIFFIEPGSLWKTATTKASMASSAMKLVNVELFNDPMEAKVLIEQWRTQYNTVRPHASSGYQPPAPETIAPADLASTVWRFRPEQPSIASNAVAT